LASAAALRRRLQKREGRQYVPDLIVFNLVVVDTKVIERITDHEIGQMLIYLKITGHPVGLILNFKRGRLEWKRVVNHCPPPF
jgi:GxxExxY protein